MTIREAYLDGRAHLAAAGVAESSIEAEMLLRFVLRVDRAALYAHWEGALPQAQQERYLGLLEERSRGRPVHYIVGEREFLGRSFAVDERVLIPRPETELLVEHAAAWLRARGGSIAVDVGTGSGCVAISLAHRMPHITVYATDISTDALDVARENARRHAVETHMRFHHGDLLSPLPPGLARQIDVIASNPPYVPQDQAGILPREIREFEPPQALFVPGDGTAVHRRLIDAAPEWLRLGGLLALEVGAGQADTVAEMVRQHGGYDTVTVVPDTVGIERVVTGALATRR